MIDVDAFNFCQVHLHGRAAYKTALQNDAAIGDGDLGCPATEPCVSEIAHGDHGRDSCDEPENPIPIGIVYADEQSRQRDSREHLRRNINNPTNGRAVEEALIALLGKDAGGLSASTIGRLKEAWSDEHTRWSKRDLSAKRYVYFWVDGIHVQARLEEAAQCLLVIIGATPEGKKELVELIDGVRESAQSWKELLLDLKRRGLAMGPELAVADGALGFWQAIEEVWPRTRGQRCWVHKTANVLNKLPKSQQSKAKRALQEIWMAETKKDALAAFDAFIETWGVKYDKAVECLIKDRDALLAFYDFPAEHWKHLRTTNPIESSFATVRHRTVRSKGCLSNKTALAMIFKLAEAAEKNWRRLDGHNQLPKIILGVRFTDGIEVVKPKAQAAAA